MTGTLLIYILCTASSYMRNEEVDVLPGMPPDTVQWWFGEEETWRIRTFALDHDIHTHRIETPADEMIAAARRTTSKLFGDIICDEIEISFDDAYDSDERVAVLLRAQLPDRIEISPGRFAFWKPDDAPYRTQSRPEEELDN